MNRPGGRTEWAQVFFSNIDSGDVDRIEAALTHDVRLIMGNSSAVEGREAVRQAFLAMNKRVRSVKHALLGVWAGEDAGAEVVSVEAKATYVLTDGRSISVPVTSTLRLQGECVRDYRIFIDTSPVFGPSS